MASIIVQRIQNHFSSVSYSMGLFFFINAHGNSPNLQIRLIIPRSKMIFEKDQALKLMAHNPE